MAALAAFDELLAAHGREIEHNGLAGADDGARAAATRSAPVVFMTISIATWQSFMLVIEKDQFIRRCHPVWSSDKRIGVASDQGVCPSPKQQTLAGSIEAGFRAAGTGRVH